MEYYPDMRRKEILSFTTWIEFESITPSKISQTDKYCMITLTCEI